MRVQCVLCKFFVGASDCIAWRNGRQLTVICRLCAIQKGIVKEVGSDKKN